ncbi:MAG: rRNA maturation RNase YbeY [Longimicrobiales bacterium]
MSDLRVDVNLGEGVRMGAQDLPPLLEQVVRAALVHENVSTAAISVTLVGDEQITALNVQYLQHDGPTDVISFPLFEQGEMPVADIYIGVDQARRQAEELGIPLDTELARLAIHGTLHVLGYDHPGEGGREGSEMWQRQEAILQRTLLH